MSKYDISSELGMLRKQLAESKEREQWLIDHIQSIELAFYYEQQCTEAYRLWFKNHEFLTKVPE